MKFFAASAAVLAILSSEVYLDIKPVFAQQSAGDINTVYNTAPLYAQENFKSDARAANLYKSNNAAARQQESWNTFQTQVRQMGSQANSGLQRLETPVSTSSTGSSVLGGYASGVSIFTGVSAALLNPMSGKGSGVGSTASRVQSGQSSSSQSGQSAGSAAAQANSGQASSLAGLSSLTRLVSMRGLSGKTQRQSDGDASNHEPDDGLQNAAQKNRQVNLQGASMSVSGTLQSVDPVPGLMPE
jgi:hypothetical protein